MAGRGCAQRQTVASTHNAVFAAQHLDGSHVVIQPHYCFHLLHHTSLAGRPLSTTRLQKLADSPSGHCSCQLDWYQLGGRMLGTLRYYNGGQWSHTISHICLLLNATSRQFLKELDSPAPESIVRPSNRRASHTRAISSPNLLRTALLNERQPLLSRRRSFEDQADNEDTRKHTRVAGGTILGIHNLAIVFPQFLVSLTHTSLSKNFGVLTYSQRLQSHQAQYSRS